MKSGIDVHLAVNLLKSGNLVGIPTETVYGLAANAFNHEAVSQIFIAKNRPSFDPLIVHTCDVTRIYEFTRQIPEQALKLLLAFAPGPLTVILEKNDLIPDLVSSGLPTIGVRIPNHPLTLELLGQLAFPLAAPSANPFGYISPTTADHVLQGLGDAVSYVLDGGPCSVGVESTIVGFQDGQAVIYRKGGLAVEAIEAVIGPVMVREHSSSRPTAPGMLDKHYAPTKKMILGHLPDLIHQYQGQNIGILSFTGEGLSGDHLFVLSPTGDDREAARNLFGYLRRLDQLPVDYILAELVPEKGLGRAINDRLRRAATR